MKDDLIVEQASIIRNYQFEINYFNDGIPYRSGEKIEIPVGEQQTLQLIGQYYSYSVPLAAFSTANIKSISIYKIEQRESNPLGGYPYDYYNFKAQNNCNTIRAKYSAEETIPLT